MNSARTIILSPLELRVIEEMNKVRTKPTSYLPLLNNWKQRFSGNQVKLSQQVFLRTIEGVNAVDEAIDFLQSTRPLSPFKLSLGMSQAARDHVRDQGETGNIGHIGGDGSTPFIRLNRYGRWQITAGENITYGVARADEIIMQLIIDDGVRDRGHRNNIFNSAFQVAGVAFGYHIQYQNMCVITYAGGYKTAAGRRE